MLTKGNNDKQIIKNKEKYLLNKKKKFSDKINFSETVITPIIFKTLSMLFSALKDGIS